MASLLSFSPLKTCTPKASASTSTSVESLDQKFGRKGIKFFESSGDNYIPAVELTVRNGSSLKLQIPNGHITSYKPKVYWKEDGFEEVLYSLAGSRGGIGLVINQPNDSSNECEWSVKDVDSDSIDAVQVLLIACLLASSSCFLGYSLPQHVCM